MLRVTALVAVAVSFVSTASADRAPRQVPGYTVKERFAPDYALSAADSAALDGTWTSCDGKTFRKQAATCRVAVQLTKTGSLCERSLANRRELAFCYATRGPLGMIAMTFEPEHGAATSYLGSLTSLAQR